MDESKWIDKYGENGMGFMTPCRFCRFISIQGRFMPDARAPPYLSSIIILLPEHQKMRADKFNYLKKGRKR